MTCDLTCIGRHLDRIASSLGAPSALEIWAVVLSAVAAGGTLGIAWLNFRLLSRQNDFERRVLEEQKQVNRRRFAHLLFSVVLEVLRARAQKVEPRFDSMDDAFLEAQFVVGAESADEMTGYAVAMAWSVPLAGGKVVDVKRAVKPVGEKINLWIADPGSLDLTIPDDWTSPLDSDRFVKL